MKVKFTVIAKVRYDGELEVTSEQYDEWCSRIDSAKGFRREDVAQDLLTAAGMSTGDPSDWDDFEVDVFDEAEESPESET
jgi:hypothetical protein